jgi:hypothetical protein
MPSQPSVAATIRLKDDAYAAWMKRLGLHVRVLQAEYIGVDVSTLGRIRRGDIVPGEQFIAACMAKYDGSFEELFEVVQ